MTLIFLTVALVQSLSSVPWSLICLIVSLILLAFAAFAGPPVADGRFYQRMNLLAAGIFFFVLASALG